jgi:hypothetical protein
MIPALEKIVWAGVDGEGVSCLWAQVGTRTTPFDAELSYRFLVVFTGEKFDRDLWEHSHTWMRGPLVFHLLVPRVSVTVT